MMRMVGKDLKSTMHRLGVHTVGELTFGGATCYLTMNLRYFKDLLNLWFFFKDATIQWKLLLFRFYSYIQDGVIEQYYYYYML